MRYKAVGAMVITLAVLSASTAFADISRSVSISICNNKVHGRCKASKDADDPFDRVLFKCQVTSDDHWPSLMGAANMDTELPMDVKASAIMNAPHPGPVHLWHQYCRRMTGVHPYERIRFFPTPRFTLGSLPNQAKCIINQGAGQTR